MGIDLPSTDATEEEPASAESAAAAVIDPDEGPTEESSESELPFGLDEEETVVAVGEYTWDDFTEEYGPDPDEAEGGRFRSNAGPDRTELLGFDPTDTSAVVGAAMLAANDLEEVVDGRTVSVNPEIDEDDFFSDANGDPTVVTRYDLEKAVPTQNKTSYQEVQRYWVNAPYAFVIIFHSTRENEKKYFVIEPYLTPIESEIRKFLSGKLRTAIKYAEEELVVEDNLDDRRAIIERETLALLERYDLYQEENGESTFSGILDLLPFGGSTPHEDLDEAPAEDSENPEETTGESHHFDHSIRPEPAILADDPAGLTRYQVEKLLYYLKRDFIGYERIDPVKHDINVEDISCDGWNSRVFVYHSEYEQLISNVRHGKEELDNFVVKLAQRSGKGISKRRPQVDATLSDGSRAQLTLGKEVSDHGTNYTIRQFKDVPFTPVDQINWKTFSLDQMALLWLMIENNKSLLFAGGTASGKTTSLNAVSLFIPSNTKIVSIEDTREVELPQRNWVASVTRPSFSGNDADEVDEFDLLHAALRQRPEYIVMGEVRGEEGRTLFQVMSTGHTTYTTFHADSVGEVLKRFTTDPINVSKTMFTALDLVSIQTQTRVQGRKVRRNKVLTEINHYDPENDEINVQDVYQWQADRDEFAQLGESNKLHEISFDRGWTQEELDRQLRLRKIVLAYLIDRGLNSYAQVAATIQAFINDPETILALMATDELEASLDALREMESVIIDIDPGMEDLVPRPEPGDETLEYAQSILRSGEDVFEEYRDYEDVDLEGALQPLSTAEVDDGQLEATDLSPSEPVDADPVQPEPATASEDQVPPEPAQADEDPVPPEPAQAAEDPVPPEPAQADEDPVHPDPADDEDDRDAEDSTDADPLEAAFAEASDDVVLESDGGERDGIDPGEG